MSIETHDGWFEQSSFLSDEVVASCSCGWATGRDSMEDAEEAWTDHCDQVFMDATS